jgi:hypothetical protein
MYTVKSVMSQLTDPKVVLQNVSDTLRRIDPNFLQEEQQYLRAVDALKEAVGDSVSPTASEYIAAREQEICAELIYVAWLGFQQNLECFQNPINTMFLKMDYEDFHRERRMHTLPEVQKALKTINAFYEVLRTLPEEKRNLTDGITDYMSYLETTGYKLAHYFGFILADQFLYHVVPGYVSDPVTKMQYRWDLQKYLQLDLKVLE